MIEREISMQDVVYVLKRGKIYLEPEPHQKTGNWIYRVQGKTLDDVYLIIPVDIQEEQNRIKILTAMISKRGD